MIARHFLIAAALCNLVSGATYIESVDGELSNDYIAPTQVNLGIGSNILAGEMSGGEMDLDLFVMSVPIGSFLSSIRVLEFTGGGGGSFIGIQPGVELSSNPVPSFNFPDAIGYAIISADDAAVDRDILSTITIGPPFNGASFLPAGNYAGWLNETGLASTYRIEFTVTPVPEPGVTTGCALGLIGWITLRRRR